MIMDGLGSRRRAADSRTIFVIVQIKFIYGSKTERHFGRMYIVPMYNISRPNRSDFLGFFFQLSSSRIGTRGVTYLILGHFSQCPTAIFASRR